MKSKQLSVVHIIKDDKFTDGVYSTFERDSRLANRAIYINNDKDYTFKYVRNIANILIIKPGKDITRFFVEFDFDIVYFHSLPVEYWSIIPLIPKDKIVIWWLYGYEIYTDYYFKGAIIDISLYKEKTREVSKEIFKEERSYVRRVISKCKKTLAPITLTNFLQVRSKMLSRIDYFQPIFSCELPLISECHKEFKAKEFYNNDSLYFDLPIIKSKNDNGGILIGNSSSATNNHADIWEKLSPLGLYNQIVVPLSYGNVCYASKIKSIMNGNNMLFLESFMKRDDYFALLDSCSYFILGVMRQQASENIYYCLSRGMKVFFYRDSIPYKYYSSKGYYVFCIEDIDKNSFSTPLTIDQIKHNQDMLLQEKKQCDTIYEDVISKLFLQKQLIDK